MCFSKVNNQSIIQSVSEELILASNTSHQVFLRGPNGITAQHKLVEFNK